MTGQQPQAARTASAVALEALRWDWGDAYEIGCDDDRGWRARRRDGLGVYLTAPDPDALYGVIAADYDLKPVPRDLQETHEAVPADFSAYSLQGPNTGCVANLANAYHFPAEGICSVCRGVICAESYGGDWAHTGRRPGDRASRPAARGMRQ